MTPQQRRRRSSGPARCRYCNAEIMWLRHVTTGKAAPLDWYPVPGGNVLIHGETYEVLAGSERAAMDPTEEDIDATPTLRMNHHSTCTSTRGRGSGGVPSAAQYSEWREPVGVDVKARAAGERPEVDD